MAFQHSLIKCVSAILLLVALSGPSVEGQSLDPSMDCRSLLATSCAFAVDSYGARCVLETSTGEEGTTVYQCQTSDILSSNGESEYIETEDCVDACGVDRMTVGISTDPFFIAGFTDKLCSIGCQKHCPNIVDLFTIIVASATEGHSLGRFCNDLHASQGHRRDMRGSQFTVSQLSSLHGISPSSSVAAEGPSSSLSSGVAEGPGGSALVGSPVSADTAEALIFFQYSP